MSDYSVHNEPDFARVYDEDEIIPIRKGDLRALLDTVTGSMDYGSGFLDNEEVEIIRAIAVMLDIDPNKVTPDNFWCQYSGLHRWVWQPARDGYTWDRVPGWYCIACQKWDHDTPPPDDPTFTGRPEERP